MKKSHYLILLVEQIFKGTQGNAANGSVDIKIARAILHSLRHSLQIEPDDEESIGLFDEYKKQRLRKCKNNRIKYSPEINNIIKNGELV